jgi:hypothetical protein
MKAWPISSRVNSLKNNDAEIIVPIELQSMSQPEDQRNCYNWAYRSPAGGSNTVDELLL